MYHAIDYRNQLFLQVIHENITAKVALIEEDDEKNGDDMNQSAHKVNKTDERTEQIVRVLLKKY